MNDILPKLVTGHTSSTGLPILHATYYWLSTRLPHLVASLSPVLCWQALPDPLHLLRIAQSRAVREPHPCQRRLPVLSILTLFFLIQSVLAALAALGIIHAFSLSLLALSGAIATVCLAWTHKAFPVADRTGEPGVEMLVQALTAKLQTTNAERVADVIASQASAATVNVSARLVEQAKERAVAEERARLARDLHDSVTQTLYSASLIAQVLPAVWQRSPAEGERNLIKLRQLVRGAMAEMRTLLFELRPAALEAANLDVLIQQLGDVLTGHTRIPVSVSVTGEAEPSVDLKITLYRIAQEAFNNIAKHAGATQVVVTLNLLPDGVDLHVSDNGRGFDPRHVPGERMGVRIMGERALKVGAGLHIASAPGQGTTLSLHWSASQDQPTDVYTGENP